MARKYTAIWNKLKYSKDIPKNCAITAHVKLHPRIIKAVSCEKNRDLGHKLTLAEAGKKAIITHRVKGSMITFYYREYYINGTIPLEDL